MSESIRQSNLFAGEDYKKVFKAYQYIDYTAYDFDTLKQALLNYIQTYYPEDFNDYIESSEFIAIVELLAYFGTSLAFRTELNSRENFIDTAERRESVIRLAQMVNYVPRRNIPASGLFKIASVQTNQPLTDANGVNINDATIFWNDPNNPDWFDQFIQICNASFSTLNPFGRPTKSGTVGSISTDLYQLNNILRLNVTYPTTVTVNGQSYPIDICNPDFVSNETIFEKDPDPANAFGFLYRNDKLGVSSTNTGFFLYFKQGNLINIDTNFDYPVPNRLFPIDIQNINQDDVYVQETDQNGTVINKWIKVPALAGENIIYNSIQHNERNIFDVISGANDTVTIRFADGNFGNVPTGLFRTWVRTSANQSLVIRPDDAKGLQINIPYVGVDQQQYTLRITFNLEQTSGNAAPTETNEQIKLRAPEVFSTQSRMVNGSDYNVLPLVYGNQIAKIQATNRAYSGQSRYIDINDPTGFHRDLIIFGQDGALYRDDKNVIAEVNVDDSTILAAGNIDLILLNNIQEVLRDPNVTRFFYDEYLPQFESTIKVNPPGSGRSLLDLVPTLVDQSLPMFWGTSPATFRNINGYFANTQLSSVTDAQTLVNTYDPSNQPNSTYQSWGFIKDGAVLEFVTPTGKSIIASVRSVIQSGNPVFINPFNLYANVGPVELNTEIENGSQAVKVTPVFRNTLTSAEIYGDLPNGIYGIAQRISDNISFWLYYDVLQDVWNTSTVLSSGNNQVQQPFVYAPTIPGSIYSDWANSPASGLIFVNILQDELAGTTFEITGRGRVYVFESYRDARFFWEPNQTVIDNASSQALKDTIVIMPYVNTNNLVDNNNPVIPAPPVQPYINTPVEFNISGVFIQDDGFLDSSKVQVSLIDADNDNIPDTPGGFDNIVSTTDRVVFEYYNNEVTGYQSTRPWIARWSPVIPTAPVYVYFPVDPNNSSILFGSGPFISTVAVVDQYFPPSDTTYYMDEYDLLLIDSVEQLDSIAEQVSVFFNSVTTITNKRDIVTNYFINKSFLISPLTNSLPGHGQYKLLEFRETTITEYPEGLLIASATDSYHFDRNGKVFTQNTTHPTEEHIPLHFKWKHYSPIDQRIDPAPSNIIDMTVITNSYYQAMVIWKNSNGSIANLPKPPTTEELRIQFQDLNKYKMVSDSMIWNSGVFKVLFGTQAETELQATFKVVKSPSSNISDNEIKTRVIQAVDIYFDIRNWDFGEKFFYTELAAFIHQQLSKIISSVVIVPTTANSQFGNLFEIIASPNQLFISSATVSNVQIVSNLTEQNLRV